MADNKDFFEATTTPDRWRVMCWRLIWFGIKHMFGKAGDTYAIEWEELMIKFHLIEPKPRKLFDSTAILKIDKEGVDE